MKFFMILILIFHSILKLSNAIDIVWGYECKSNKCIKIQINEENFNSAISYDVCRLICSPENTINTIWPRPTGSIVLNKYVSHINMQSIEFNFPRHEAQAKMWSDSKERFQRQLEAKVPSMNLIKNLGKKLVVKINVESGDIGLTMNTDESYELSLGQSLDEVLCEINAKTYYGARHGLETLSQLIVFDDVRREVQIIGEVTIKDAPKFKHRGLLLDTSRSYFSVDSIKRTLDGMAMTKLNVFHWHITDSQSFPMVIKSRPDLYKLGAYSSKHVYTPEDIKDVVQYGRVRGVRVIPEFDAPAHVGEGWQNKNMTVCFKKQPWKDYCVEPPCGQLNPTVDDLYNVLEDIYREMYETFDSPDIFHMGGDEVSMKCWNTDEQIKQWMKAKNWGDKDEDYMKLWNYFQENALERLDRVTGNPKLPIIMWTSHLTEDPYVTKYLDKNRYIIQVWTTGFDSKVRTLLRHGYNLILSNYDALYFDCGGPGWVTSGQNWCSPYIGWQAVYDNSPRQIAGNEHISQIWGAEAAIWSEQIDETTLDSRFWPRASALAERLWSDPTESWRAAESRMVLHRERLFLNNIGAEAVQPRWCLQNEHECPIDAKDVDF